jgi:hypothetical protein
LFIGPGGVSSGHITALGRVYFFDTAGREDVTDG